MPATPTFEAHAVRGPLNAAFFSAFDGILDWYMRPYKQRVFRGLPRDVVEVGAGVGANFRYLAPGSRVVAVEPNPHMHAGLRRRAARHDVELDIRGVTGESIDLDDASTDAVISSLVLCTVSDPAQVVGEIRRILRPGGRYAFLEHVAAPAGTAARRLQHAVRRPWAWCFEGCSCERDLAAVIRSAGFASVSLDAHRMHSPFLPANTQIAGIATA